MAVPYTFGSATTSIPLSQLDSNFATTITLGNTAIQLGNTVTTLNNMTFANATVSSGNVTVLNATVTNDASIAGQTVGKGGGAVSTNTAVGASALAGNTTGSLNTAIGYEALVSNTTADASTATGYRAAYLQSTGALYTCAFGYRASYSNSSGAQNNAFGFNSLFTNTAGSNNSGFGTYTLQYTTGSNNTGIGNEALRYNTTASNNTAVGYQAGYANTTGDYQSLLGLNAGAGITTGVRNTCLGAQAGNHTTPITTGNYNVIIGSFTVPSASAGANQIVIGYDCQGIGDNYFTFGKSGNRVYNQFSANASWTQSSDERLKTNIKDDILGLEFICKLKPRTYTWKPSNEVPEELTGHYKENNEKDTNVVMNGFIAQEVKEALDFVGSPTFSGWSIEPDGTQAVSREMFVLPLVKAIQELKTIVDAQAAEIAALQAKVGA